MTSSELAARSSVSARDLAEVLNRLQGLVEKLSPEAQTTASDPVTEYDEDFIDLTEMRAAFEQLPDYDDGGRRIRHRGGAGPSVGSKFPALRLVAGLSLDDPFFRLARTKSGDERTRAWLHARGISTVAALLDLTRDDFLGEAGFGPTKVQRIFDYLSRLAVAAPIIAARLKPSEEGSLERDVAGTIVADPPSTEAVSSLRTVIAWATTVGGAKTWADALALVNESLPEDVYQALQTLMSTDLAVEQEPSPIAAFLEADPRAAKILVERIVWNEPRVLREIADELGVSHERVRQLEKRALEQLRISFSSEPSWQQVRWAADRLVKQAGAFAPSGVLLEALPGPPPVEARLIAVLADYARVEPELVRNGVNLPTAEQLPVLEGTENLIDEFELVDSLKTLGIESRFLDFAIDAIGSVNRVDGELVLWRGSAVDKAVAVLEVRDSPQDIDQLITSVLGDSRSRSLRNRILDDDRIMRVTKNKVGLRRWGGVQYTGVADLMRERLASGPMDLGELAAELAERYEVSAASVRMYGAAPAFRVVGETIALRTHRHPYVARNCPAKVRGLYRDRTLSTTVWCVSVDDEMLRGSSRPIPAEIARDMGVSPGDRVDLETAAGSIRISWSETSNAGAQLGSIRGLLTMAGATVGEEVALRFSTDTQSLAMTKTESPAPSLDASLAISLRTTLPLSSVAQLHGLSETLEVPESEVVAALEMRGDRDVAALARKLPSRLRSEVEEATGTISAGLPLAPHPSKHDRTVPQRGRPPGSLRRDEGSSAISYAPRAGVSVEDQKELERQFDADVDEAMRGMAMEGYNVEALRRIIRTVGSRRAAELIVRLPEPSDALVALERRGRLDLTLEALVACEYYRRLFPSVVVASAMARLAEFDFSVDE